MSTATQNEAARLPTMTGVPIKRKKRSRHCCSRLFLPLATLFLSGTAWGIDFKGIELGKPLRITEELSVFGRLDCNPMQMDPEEHKSYLQELQQVIPGVRKVCTGATSVAAIPADVTVILGASRRVLRLTFQFAAENYPQVINAMTTKWGEGFVEAINDIDESVWWEFDDGSSISVHHTSVTDRSNSSNDLTLVGLVEYALPISTPAGDL